MFEKILNWIKGVITRMFSNDTIQSSLGVNVAVSNDMSKAIALFEDIYLNRAPWLKKDEVISLELGASIANEFARLTTLEMKSEITGSKRADFLNEQYQKVLKSLSGPLEEGNAVGGLVFKPYVKAGKIYVDLVRGSCFYPTEFDSSGNIIAGIFVNQLTKGDALYTRLEYHKFYETAIENNINYIIKNAAYKSTDKATLGTKIDLSQVPEWATIDEVTGIQFVEKPLFSYYKPPIANNIDPQSPIGVSVYARAVHLIEKADVQYGRIDWEYEASEKAIFVDEQATKPSQSRDKKKSFTVNKLKGRLYKTLNAGEEGFFKDYSPEIRDEELWRGLNKTLERIEFTVGLAYGTLSVQTNNVEKKEEEIIASKQRSYATVSKMQDNLQTALENLVYAMDVLTTLYHLAPAGSYETLFDWDDSLVVDINKKQSQSLIERNAKLIDDVEYFIQTRGYSEDEAIEYVNNMRKRSKNVIEPEDDEE